MNLKIAIVLLVTTAFLMGCCSVPNDNDYPEKPDFGNLIFKFQRDKLFGELDYEPWFGKGNITITNDWKSEYLVKSYIPQLKTISFEGKNLSGYTWINKNIETQYKMLWHAWEMEGLLDRINSWAGGYAERKVRGSYIFLSNHAYGTAFDINAKENPYGRRPAKNGETGSVYDLVAIAHEHGFYWGGHFCKLDGMHFEASVILDEQELVKLAKKYGYQLENT